MKIIKDKLTEMNDVDDKKVKRKSQQKKTLDLKSIKVKLIVYFSLLMILAFTALSIVSLTIPKNELIKSAEESILISSQDAATLMDSRIRIQTNALASIALSQDMQDMNWEEQQMEMKAQVENSDFLGMAIVDLDKNARYDDGSTQSLEGVKLIEVALNGSESVSDLVIDPATDEIAIMYAAPIKKNNKVVGALMGYRDGLILSENADGTGRGNDGYGYILNKSGTIVGHPNRELVINGAKPIELSQRDKSYEGMADLFEKILVDTSGTSKYESQDGPMYAGYSPIEGTEWIFVVTSSEEETLAAIPLLQKSLLITTIIILLLSVAAVYIIGHSIAKPIVVAVDISKRIAALDLRDEIPEEYLNRTDELGILAHAFDAIITNLRDIMERITSSSSQLAAASQEMTASTEESAITAEEVTKTMEEIARGAEDQASTTEAGSLKADLLGEAIDDNEEYLNGLNDSSNRVGIIVNEGLSEIDNLSNITEESAKSIEEIHEVILKTNQSSNEINQASNVIASIAEQTNLLALNAAIEAARAGDAGRGFAVVADEIRTLAEQSAESTFEIDKVVKELQENSSDAVELMEKVTEITGEQRNNVESSKTKYLEISQAMEYAMKATENLNVSENKMVGMKNEIVDAIQNLTAIAEENSAATEEASAAMEEQSASVEEIAGSSEGLSKLAEDLQSIIERFQI